jgi:hypothetical protein
LFQFVRCVFMINLTKIPNKIKVEQVFTQFNETITK